MDNENRIPDPTEQDDFLNERMGRVQTANFPEQPVYPQMPYPKKSTAAAVLLSFIPGCGHLYLGLMQRGLFFMMLVILNIVAIVFFSPVGPGEFVIPLVVLFALLLPVILIYSIFDALQSTYVVNAKGFVPNTETYNLNEVAGVPLNKLPKSSLMGWILIVAGGIFFFISEKPSWMVRLYDVTGSYIGALILIGIGAFLFLHESKKKK